MLLWLARSKEIRKILDNTKDKERKKRSLKKVQHRNEKSKGWGRRRATTSPKGKETTKKENGKIFTFPRLQDESLGLGVSTSPPAVLLAVPRPRQPSTCGAPAGWRSHQELDNNKFFLILRKNNNKKVPEALGVGLATGPAGLGTDGGGARPGDARAGSEDSSR